MSVDVEQRIRERAYAIWLAQGCPEGCDGAHWLQAERDVAAESESVAAPAAKAPRKTTAKVAKAAKVEPVVEAPPAVDAGVETTKPRKPRARKVVPA